MMFFYCYFNNLGGGYASTYRAGWWYGSSHYVGLNHIYYGYEINEHGSIIWYAWQQNTALKAVDMKIRPDNY